jgi:hypothetical protein
LIFICFKISFAEFASLSWTSSKKIQWSIQESLSNQKLEAEWESAGIHNIKHIHSTGELSVPGILTNHGFDIRRSNNLKEGYLWKMMVELRHLACTDHNFCYRGNIYAGVMLLLLL